MRSFRILFAIAVAALLSGCYTTTPMYLNVGTKMDFGESYACGDKFADKLERYTTVEHVEGKMGTWYEINGSDQREGKEKSSRYAFHPLGNGKYIISADREDSKVQLILIARINGDTIDIVGPKSEKQEGLLNKHRLTNDLRDGLIGDQDAKHQFFLDIAAASDSDLEIVQRCRRFF